MQTIDFIQTSKWIVSLFSEEAKQFILTSQGFSFTHDASDQSKIIGPVIRAAHELSSIINELLAHPFAPEILRGFNLEQLLDKTFPVRISEVLASPRESPRLLIELEGTLSEVWKHWRIFSNCLDPVERLTIPTEIISEQDFDDVLTIELRYEDRFNPKAETISGILSNTTILYEAIAIIYGLREFSPLTVIYADSGSSFRFDLKGLGEPIKRIKELFVEGWNLIRHRKVEDFRQNNKALLESLESIRKIHTLLEQGVLNDEEASRLNRQVLESALSLFEAGVLPREIPKVEIVSNQTLLQGIHQKLLPPAPDQDEVIHSKDKSRQKRRGTKARKKASHK